MVNLAREAYPGLRFHVGSMTALDLPDASLGGVLALYSTIHLPDEGLRTACAEFRRTLVPGGHVLLCFQSGTAPGRLHLAERFGQEIDLDYYWRTPEQVAGALTGAGLDLVATALREPAGEETAPAGAGAGAAGVEAGWALEVLDLLALRDLVAAGDDIHAQHRRVVPSPSG